MTTRFSHLPSRRVIRVGGLEAKEFLQGLISNDVEKVAPQHSIYAALLNAQGKLAYDFIVLSDNDGGYLLDVEAARADELIKKLKLYRLRAKVMIEPSDVQVTAYFGPDDVRIRVPQSEVCCIDPRFIRLGYRFYTLLEPGDNLAASLPGDKASEADYIAYRLSLGVPEGAGELGVEKLFLLEANIEELSGVDFKKGCYVGQELTARMKHKTELKKRLLPFRVSPMPAPDTPLTAGERELGSTVGGRLDVAFVLTRLQRLAEADPASLTIGGAPAMLIKPAYLPAL
jgi:tRNA-modifying protein YgfZ